jgi:DNA-directed RNA polymerase omega subunit
MITNNQNPNTKKRTETYSLDHLVHMAGGGVFGLARVAMLRAIEIHFGSPPLIEHAASDKETTIALNEIAQGRIGLKH